MGSELAGLYLKSALTAELFISSYWLTLGEGVSPRPQIAKHQIKGNEW